MEFRSILFEGTEPDTRIDEDEDPAFLRDLNLDQIIESLLAGREEYGLGSLFHTPLRDLGTIRYRQAALRDLEEPRLFDAVQAFAENMRTVRARMVQSTKAHYRYEREGWFLEAVAAYCDAVRSLGDHLARADLASDAFVAFRQYLVDHTRSREFVSLAAETSQVRELLGAIQYALHIKGNRVGVRRYEGEPDYSAQVEETFERFKQGAVKDYRAAMPTGYGLNHVEARILDLVARLYPESFTALTEHCARHHDYLDPTIATFDREVHFYLAYLEHIRPLRDAGLPFCYPQVSTESKEIRAVETFDLALASKLVGSRRPVVLNDFSLTDPERIVVVTGPNQGGKSTFARMVGQLHYLASLGYPVPGSEARVYLADRVLSHFEREEDLRTLRGKLEDELVRMRDILEAATADSLLIVNESLTSTTLGDALFVGREVLLRIQSLGALCVWVTFVDELATLSEATVSMMSTVAPDDPAVRTYRVVRRPADGRAYAVAIAAKYGLTYDALRQRTAR